MLTGNKGEWSEIYALLKILSDKNLYQGDGDLKRIENAVLPIIKVLRDESNGTYDYSYDQNLVIINGVDECFSIPIEEFKQHATKLLEQIKAASSTFTSSEIEGFLKSFKCTSLKATSSKKSDIRIVIHDQKTGLMPELGFSIKSQIGSASTLLNAGKTTNFKYRLISSHFDEADIAQINAIDSKSKIKDRLSRMLALGMSLEYVATENTIFENNLVLIDSLLPKILSEVVLRFYTSNSSTLSDLTSEIHDLNPLNFDVSQKHPFYEYKLKRFLSDIALGMMPSTVWTGILEANGGYLVIKEDGEILAYHIYNRNDFEDYLFKNTKLETASSSRHDFGSIFKHKNEYFIKLNLQIRFLK